ncbi:MAG: ATP-binding protein [Planctomycetota bacterium]|nr:ATP-binding protein [Planctomycetota bacterium]
MATRRPVGVKTRKDETTGKHPSGDDRTQHIMATPEITPEPPADLNVAFYSRPIYLSAIRHMLDAFCERMGMDPNQSARVCLAVDEAICNVIRHGYGGDPNGRIELAISRLEENGPTLQIDILDRAACVDLDTIRSRDLEEVRPGGLGVHIIQEIMTEVEYSHREGGGMRLRMRHPLATDKSEGSSKPNG